MPVARASALPDSKMMPVSALMSSGMPPMFAPTTGVPAQSDSITPSGLFSYHSEGSTEICQRIELISLKVSAKAGILRKRKNRWII